MLGLRLLNNLLEQLDAWKLLATKCASQCAPRTVHLGKDSRQDMLAPAGMWQCSSVRKHRQTQSVAGMHVEGRQLAACRRSRSLRTCWENQQLLSVPCPPI